MDTVIVTPEKGRRKEIGQRLFAIAAEKGVPASAITWTTYPVGGFKVPLDLFTVFEQGDAPHFVTAAVDDTTLSAIRDSAADVVALDEKPKRRGRPRRTPVTDDTDNTHSEEE